MAICYRYIGDKEIAKDVLQEALILIFKNIKKYEPVGSFEGWMSRITVTTALKHIRDNIKIRHLEDWEKHIDVQIEPEALTQMDAEEILALIDKLPNHYKIIFNLYAIEGYSHTEISEMLNITESTSRSKLTRARQKLQEMFSKNNEKQNTVHWA